MRWSALALLAVEACRSHTRAEPLVPDAAGAVDRPASDAPSGAVSDAAAAPAAPGAPPVTTDWCIDGLSALDEDVCYVLPARSIAPRRLLVYLHGIVPPLPDSPQKRTVQSVVLRASERAGAAAIVPRGRRGIGPGQARDWWAWPTTAGAVAALTPSILSRWVAAKKELESIIGAPFDRTYLAGSSNGAYYLTMLVARGDVPAADFPVDGFGAMSGGGAGAGDAGRFVGYAPRPFYIGYGAYDDASRANAQLLAAALEAARWPVRVAVHPFGHGANERYLDEAFAFWHAAD